MLFIRSQKCICDEFINDQINNLIRLKLQIVTMTSRVQKAKFTIGSVQLQGRSERAVKSACVYCIRIKSCAQIDNARVNIEYTSSIKASRSERVAV